VFDSTIGEFDPNWKLVNSPPPPVPMEDHVFVPVQVFITCAVVSQTIGWSWAGDADGVQFGSGSADAMIVVIVPPCA
jgi:hypothetical protein